MRSSPAFSIFCVVVVLLTGCAQPYQRPVFEEVGPTGNVADLTAPVAGLSSLFSHEKPGRILWTHGMCRHDTDWVERRIALVNHALGIAADPPHLARHGDSPNAYSIPWRFSTPRGDVDTSFLVWSPLIEPYRQKLLFDNSSDHGGNYRYQRATLNDEFKALLMNQCLLDAVVYSGSNGDNIRAAMLDAVCDALGGEIRDGSCGFAPGASTRRVAFVTESLGSKFLFDAIRKIWNSQNTDSARSEFARRFAQIAVIYMDANQVPLLDQANPVESLSSSDVGKGPTVEQSSLRALGRIVSKYQLPALQLVAFTDPNDLLSYRLDRSTESVPGLRLINVIVSNDTTWFGAVERPDNAHCGYAQNPNVIKFMVDGFDGGTKSWPDLGPTKADNSCLSG